MVTDAQLHVLARFAGGETQSIAVELLEARRLLRGEPSAADADRRMRTLSGWMHPLAPRPGEIQIRDIARGLATQPRYKGQTSTLLSVAEHCVIVSLYVAPEHARQALLHDASEAYLGDMIGPIKLASCLAGFRAIEDRLQAAIYEAFGVVTTPESNADVRNIDHRSCASEMPQLLEPGLLLEDAEIAHAAHMERCRISYGEPLAAAIPCLPWRQAEYLFLARFAELFPELVLT